jgi:plasmid replication initiation protein
MTTKKRKGGNALVRQNEHLYAQSNQLVEAHYKEALSLWEMFLFSKMCTMVEVDDTDFKTYKIYIKEALDFLDIKKGGHNYKYVVEAAQRLLDRRITTYYVNENGKTIAVDTHLVNSVHRIAEPENEEDSDSLFVALTFPPELKPMLLQLKDNFTMLDLDVFKQLKTPTSIRMYQLLSAHLWKRDKKVVYDLEELKQKLGVAEKYEQYGAFKTYVLHDAQKRLDETSFLGFTFQEIKKGKRVEAIEFRLTDKRPQANKQANALAASATTPISVSETQKDDLQHDRLIAELSPVVVIQFGVSLRVFGQLVRQHTEGVIRQAVKVTEKAAKSGRVENIAGFFVGAVRGKYQDTEGGKTEQNTSGNTLFTQNNERTAEKTAANEAAKRAEQTRQEAETEYRRIESERQKAWVKSLAIENPALLEQALSTLQNGMFKFAYEEHKTLEENLESPMFLGILMGIFDKMKT